MRIDAASASGGTQKDVCQDTLLDGTTISCSCRKAEILKRRSGAMRAMRARIAKKAAGKMV